MGKATFAESNGRPGRESPSPIMATVIPRPRLITSQQVAGHRATGCGNSDPKDAPPDMAGYRNVGSAPVSPSSIAKRLAKFRPSSSKDQGIRFRRSGRTPRVHGGATSVMHEMGHLPTGRRRRTRKPNGAESVVNTGERGRRSAFDRSKAKVRTVKCEVHRRLQRPARRINPI